jgi:hypothetical protein
MAAGDWICPSCGRVGGSGRRPWSPAAHPQGSTRRTRAKLIVALLYLPSLYLLGQLRLFVGDDLLVAFAVLSVLAGLLLADWRAFMLPPIALLLTVQDVDIQTTGLAGAFFVIGTLIAETGMIAGVLAARTWSSPTFVRRSPLAIRLLLCGVIVALSAVWIHYGAFVFTASFDSLTVCEAEPCLGIPTAEGDRDDGPGISGLQWYAMTQGALTLLGIAYAAMFVAGALRFEVRPEHSAAEPGGSGRWLLAPGLLALWISTVGIASFSTGTDDEPINLQRCLDDLGTTVYSPGPVIDGQPLRLVYCFSGQPLGIQMIYGTSDPGQGQVMVQSRPACQLGGPPQRGIADFRGRRVRVGGAIGVLDEGNPHGNVTYTRGYERLDLFTQGTLVTIQQSTVPALQVARSLRPGFPADPSNISVPASTAGSPSRLPRPEPGALQLRLPCPDYSLPFNRTVDLAGD